MKREGNTGESGKVPRRKEEALPSDASVFLSLVLGEDTSRVPNVLMSESKTSTLSRERAARRDTRFSVARVARLAIYGARRAKLICAIN